MKTIPTVNACPAWPGEIHPLIFTVVLRSGQTRRELKSPWGFQALRSRVNSLPSKSPPLMHPPHWCESKTKGTNTATFFADGSSARRLDLASESCHPILGSRLTAAGKWPFRQRKYKILRLHLNSRRVGEEQVNHFAANGAQNDQSDA